MINLNKVMLMGNLTRDPELRYTPAGIAVVTLGLAVNKSFVDKNGQKQKEVCFINIIAWNKLAENCNEYLAKGRGIFVEGRLKSRTWTTNDGQKRSTIEIVANNIQFMPKTQPITTGTTTKNNTTSTKLVVEKKKSKDEEFKEVIDNVIDLEESEGD